MGGMVSAWGVKVVGVLRPWCRQFPLSTKSKFLSMAHTATPDGPLFVPPLISGFTVSKWASFPHILTLLSKCSSCTEPSAPLSVLFDFSFPTSTFYSFFILQPKCQSLLCEVGLVLPGWGSSSVCPRFLPGFALQCSCCSILGVPRSMGSEILSFTEEFPLFNTMCMAQRRSLTWKWEITKLSNTEHVIFFSTRDLQKKTWDRLLLKSRKLVWTVDSHNSICESIL